jgi:hypothetical protein
MQVVPWSVAADLCTWNIEGVAQAGWREGYIWYQLLLLCKPRMSGLMLLRVLKESFLEGGSTLTLIFQERRKE